MEQYYFHLRMSESVFSIASLLVGVIFLITRGPKGARLGVKVLLMIVIALFIGFGFFWPYKITLSNEGVTTSYFFKKETIKYNEIEKVQITRNASRGGKLKEKYTYTIKSSNKKISFDQESFPDKHKLIIEEIIGRSKLKLRIQQDSGILFQEWIKAIK